MDDIHRTKFKTVVFCVILIPQTRHSHATTWTILCWLPTQEFMSDWSFHSTPNISSSNLLDSASVRVAIPFVSRSLRGNFSVVIVVDTTGFLFGECSEYVIVILSIPTTKERCAIEHAPGPGGSGRTKNLILLYHVMELYSLEL